jgi:hypothetical protein
MRVMTQTESVSVTDAEIFAMRRARSAADLWPMLERLYGAHPDYAAFRARLDQAMEAAWAARAPALKRLDLARDLEPEPGTERGGLRLCSRYRSGDQTGEVRVMMFDRSDMTWKYSDSKVCEQPVLGFLDEQGDQLRLYTDMGTIDMAAADLKNENVLMAKLGECKGEEAMAAAH